MKRFGKTALMAVSGLLLPYFGRAQGLAEGMHGMHTVLESLYDEMMPLCSQLIGVAQGIAGFAATWYIASRVWRHIANAEPVDFYPLFRPFVLGFCIMIFPSVLGLINGIMKPTVTATAAMVEGSNKSIAVLLQKKEEAIKQTDVWQMYVGESGNGDSDRWYKYMHDDADPREQGVFEGIGNEIKFALSKASYNFRNSIKEAISEVLHLFYETAALCINTLRTFQLLVLAILGPLVFGIAVFDGLQHTLFAWIARYLNIFLWLPVANIFGAVIGKIQEKMLEMDIQEVGNYGDTVFNRTDMAYMAFMIIGIIGYFTVPSVANYIVHAGGGALTQKATNIATSSVTGAAGASAAGAGAMWDAARQIDKQSMNWQGRSNDSYMGDKLKGDS